MEFVVCNVHRGYSVPKEVMAILGINDSLDERMEVRSSKAFVDYVKANGSDFLGIVEIPEKATDYRIFEYDGLESVVYVIDGKIVDADVKMYKKL